MSTTTTAEEIRAHTRAMWGGVAAGWEQHADYVETRGAHVTERMLARTAPRLGERVLELASGAGDIAIAAAPLVAPGEVVVSDVAAEMVDIAARRAGARGLANVTPRVFGVEAIDDEDASYDVVLCREGLMFAVDPELAAREIARVLRPGGRTALAVWGPREQNPWLGCVFDAVSAQFERPMPPPGIPGPFSLGDAGRLQHLLAGELELVEVEEVAVPLTAASFDEWWSRVSALAGPLSSILGGMPGEARTALRGRLEDAALPYRTADGGLNFPGVSLLATGRRAE
jgi:ubiquinone/menaquinone biosynthesis C-methylase UbiE